MELKKYLIVEDSLLDAELLQNYLAPLPFIELVAVSTSLEETISILSTQKISFLFLDVKLANQSGLSLLNVYANLPPVIIISAYPEYAIESYRLGKAVDYIVKPYTYERLLIAIDRALSLRVSPSSLIEKNFIFLKMGHQINRFELSAIDYVEAYGVYVKVYSNDKLFIVNERLSIMNRLLPSNLFVRVHKSFIINISKITGYRRDAFVLHTHKIPIGNSYRPSLMSLLRLFDRSDGEE